MSVDLQPLPNPRRADGVFEQLRSRILAGAYPPDSRLPTERELAEALEVNRGSVREALKRLEFLELVEVRHGQGTFVREMSESSALQLIEALLRDPSTITTDLIEQTLEFRRHNTLHVVELAARNRTDQQLRRGRELLERETRLGANPDDALEIDLKTNALLGEASGNLIYQLVNNLFTKLVRHLGPLYYNERRDHARSLATHRDLFAALERRDAAEARRIIGTMLDYSDKAILREAHGLETAKIIGPDAEAGDT
jgi:GntR family transcriptional repressor for pyruvate dehydrogenase complex